MMPSVDVAARWAHFERLAARAEVAVKARTKARVMQLLPRMMEETAAEDGVDRDPWCNSLSRWPAVGRYRF